MRFMYRMYIKRRMQEEIKMNIFQAKYCIFKKKQYLCIAFEKNNIKCLPVPWMSGLVSGLQNRVRRFESARNLTLLKKLIATVPWMSGLVSGLQNRVRRFESARNLKTAECTLSSVGRATDS